MRLPIRARLTAWYVAVLALILLALGAYLPLRLRAELTGEIDQSLTIRAAQISEDYQRDGRSAFHEISNAALAGLPIGHSGAQVLTPGGQVVDHSDDPLAREPMVAPALVGTALAGGPVRRTIQLGPKHHAFRVLVRPTGRGEQRQVLVVAASLRNVDAAVGELLLLLLTAGPPALLAVALGGWWLAHHALRPIAVMTAKADRISVDHLDERIPVPKVTDEVGRLARTLNTMLDRLEHGVDEQRRLVADASHELRTPLAVMRSELDVALADDALAPEAVRVLASTAEEVDRMTHIIGNLLTLARFDQGRLELLTRPVDLHGEAETVAAKLRSQALAKGLRIETRRPGGEDRDGADGAVVLADRERVDQVISNLLDNAIKYTQRHDVIRVDVWREGPEVLLSVTDTGPGIPAADLAKVFQRFYRVDAARNRTVGGSGLGLAICEEIIRAHGGRIWVESRLGHGSRFCFALPAPHTDQ